MAVFNSFSFHRERPFFSPIYRSHFMPYRRDRPINESTVQTVLRRNYNKEERKQCLSCDILVAKWDLLIVSRGQNIWAIVMPLQLPLFFPYPRFPRFKGCTSWIPVVAPFPVFFRPFSLFSRFLSKMNCCGTEMRFPPLPYFPSFHPTTEGERNNSCLMNLNDFTWTSSSRMACSLSPFMQRP